MSTDEQLLAAYRASHSDQAFAEIVRRHAGLVLRSAMRTLNNLDEAEDVMQAVFLVLAQRPQAVGRSLSGWLHEVARRTACKVLRSRTRRARHETAAARQAPLAVAVAEVAADLRQQLDAALDRLPERLREAVILRYLEGREQEDAARLAGCPRTTLVARCTEGLNRLRILLSRRGVEVSASVLIAFLATEASASCVRVVAITAASASAGAGVGVVAATPTALLAESAVKGMFWAKAQLCAMTVASVVTVATIAPLLAPAGPPSWQAFTVERATLRGHTREVGSVAFSPDGKRLATGSYDGNAKLWNLTTGQEELHLPGTDGSVHQVTFSRDGQSLAVAANTQSARLWDLTTGQERTGFQPSAVGKGSFVTFSRDGQLLASALGNDVKVWDLVAGKEWATLRGHTDQVNPGSSFAPQGTLLATGSYDCTVRLWDVDRRQERNVLRGHTSCVPCLSFSPDGKSLASASWDRTAKIWEVATGQERRTFSGHIAEVASVSFSPDGKLLATGSFDRTVKLWDTATGQELATLTGHTDRVWRVAFSPDGKTLASASADRTVKLWGTAPKR